MPLSPSGKINEARYQVFGTPSLRCMSLATMAPPVAERRPETAQLLLAGEEDLEVFGRRRVRGHIAKQVGRLASQVEDFGARDGDPPIGPPSMGHPSRESPWCRGIRERPGQDVAGHTEGRLAFVVLALEVDEHGQQGQDESSATHGAGSPPRRRYSNGFPPNDRSPALTPAT